MVKYKGEQVNSIIMLLDSMDIRGIQNAKRMVMIRSILDQGIKEGEQENGSNKHSGLPEE